LEPGLAGALSMRRIPENRYRYGLDKELQEAHKAEQAQQVREIWETSEVPWLQCALRGPLVDLSLVEVSFPEGEDQPFMFRLTETGRAAIWQPFRPPAARVVSPKAAPAKCWVVQSNLDVIVYLDRVTAERLSFIGRVAEAGTCAGSAATYTLTRDSIYGALESGLELPAIVEGLQSASEQPLSDSLRRTLADWAARRERIRLRRGVLVAEFPGEAARAGAIARWGLAGVPLGERFLVLPEGEIPREFLAALSGEIDYTSAPTPCLEVAEDGTIREVAPTDLLAREELRRWGDPVPDTPGVWRLTGESVRRSVLRGGQVSRLLAVIEARCAKRTLPPVLRIAITAWATGCDRRAGLSQETVLLLSDPDLAAAIEGSTLFSPYLRRCLGPGAYLVAAEQEAELRALLTTFGIVPAGAGVALLAPTHSPETPMRNGARGRRRRK
jgi:hypothetical protein